jgi:hypothetical protein
MYRRRCSTGVREWPGNRTGLVRGVKNTGYPGPGRRLCRAEHRAYGSGGNPLRAGRAAIGAAQGKTGRVKDGGVYTDMGGESENLHIHRWNVIYVRGNDYLKIVPWDGDGTNGGGNCGPGELARPGNRTGLVRGVKNTGYPGPGRRPCRAERRAYGSEGNPLRAGGAACGRG